MPLALILSSHVAGSRVGGFPQALALARLGVDPVLIPTVLFGRRPGLDTPPGGGAVGDALFRGMLQGVGDHGLHGLADAVVTGYFASADQVAAAAETIDAVRAASREGAATPRPVIVVDPILGDEPDGLYVKPEVAEAVAALLLPRADVLTPNLWELRRLSSLPAAGPAGVIAAARSLSRPVLATSVDFSAGEIGGLWVDADQAVAIRHLRLPSPPHGTGDLLAAVLAAGLIAGRSPGDAAVQAIRTAAEAVQAARDWSAPELPLVGLAERLANPTAPVRVEIL